MSVKFLCLFNLCCSEQESKSPVGTIIDITPRPDYPFIGPSHILSEDGFINEWYTIPVKGEEGMEVDITHDEIVVRFHWSKPQQVEFERHGNTITLSGIRIFEITFMLEPSLDKIPTGKYMNVKIGDMIGRPVTVRDKSTLLLALVVSFPAMPE